MQWQDYFFFTLSFKNLTELPLHGVVLQKNNSNPPTVVFAVRWADRPGAVLRRSPLGTNSRGGPVAHSLASTPVSDKHGAMFRLDPRLDQDTVPLAQLTLAHVLLMCDARYPWLILVPAKPDLRELHDLDAADRTQLIEEITQVSRVLERLFKPDKINGGAEVTAAAVPVERVLILELRTVLVIYCMTI